MSEEQPQSRVDELWFKARLHDVKKSQRQLALSIGIDPSSLSKTLKGQRRMQLNEAASIAKELQVPFQEVVERAGIAIRDFSPLESGMVPVVGTVGEDGIAALAEKTLYYVPAPPDIENTTVALQLETLFSELTLLDGWVLYYTPADRVLPQAMGRLCVVGLESGETAVRFIQRGRNGQTYRTLRLYHQEALTERLLWASPVLWMRP